MKKTLVKIIIGIIVIGGGLSYLVYSAMQSSWAYYMSVDEFVGKKSLIQSHTMRIAGIVGTGSITRDVEKMQVAFTLKGKASSLGITYSGVVPDNFAEDREVVVEGRVGADGVFQASKLITKCESKYQAKSTTDSDQTATEQSSPGTLD